jgi:hypothetical protein
LSLWPFGQSLIGPHAVQHASEITKMAGESERTVRASSLYKIHDKREA